MNLNNKNSISEAFYGSQNDFELALMEDYHKCLHIQNLRKFGSWREDWVDLNLNLHLGNSGQLYP